MKLYLSFLFFILISFVKSQDKNCNDIIPEKPSDCKLSEEDKKLYKFCCMEDFAGDYTCFAYDENSYKLQKAVYERDKINTGKDYVFECNSFSIKFVFFYFLIVLLLEIS